MTRNWKGYPRFHEHLVTAMAEDMRRGSKPSLKSIVGVSSKKSGFHTVRTNKFSVDTKASRVVRKKQLTAEDVRAIRKAMRNTKKFKHGAGEIAKQYNVTVRAIQKIVNRETWAHVP